MKKLAIAFILIFSLSFFYGCNEKEFSCGGDVVYSGVRYFQTGEIVQTMGIGVDSEKLNDAASLNEKTVFISNLIKQMDLLRQKFILNFAIIYLQNPVDEMKIGQGVKISQCAYRQKVDMVAFDVMFSSASAWRFYHGIKEEENAQNTKLPILFEKRESKGVFPFAAEDKDGELIGKSYKKLYLNAAKGLSFEKEINKSYSPTFVYTYSTHSSALKSNAKYLQKDNRGMFNHIWTIEEKNLSQENKTVIYYNIINKGMWILFAVLLPILALLIYLLMVKTKKKKYVN